MQALRRYQSGTAVNPFPVGGNPDAGEYLPA